jgi:hypothetical protein
MPYYRFTATISPVIDGLLLQSLFDTFVLIFQNKKKNDLTVNHGNIVVMPVFQLIQLWHGMRDYILIG